MSTMSKVVTESKSILLRDWLDAHAVPYVLCHIDIIDGKKTIRKSTIPQGWQNWDYDVTCFYNNTRADPKCSIMNINLRAANMVVVDIDGGDIDALIKKYGGQNITKSINRGMPHIWFERTDDDPYSTKIKIEGTDVDYLYNNVFESVDSVLTECDGHLDIFEWDVHLGEPPKINKTIKQTNKTHNIENSEPLLDLIHPRYWTAYDTWRNLVWACCDHYGKEEGIKVATRYSKLITSAYEEGCVEKVAHHFIEGKITWGTAHHYARMSDPDAYAVLVAPRIQPDDETLAHLFLNAFGINITKDVNGDIFVYYKDGWRRSDKETPRLIRGLMSDITQPIIETAIKVNCDKMERLSYDDPEKEKLRKENEYLRDTKQRIRSSNGTDAIYRKIRDILAQRPNTDILFDVGKEQDFNIHFKNGVYELDKKRFRKRTKDDYITATEKWNYYDQRDEEKIKIVKTFFHKTQPDPEMRRFLLQHLAYCLCGDTSQEIFKMNIGSGGNGKTAEFSIHMICFPNYTMKVENKTFNEDYQQRHKQLAPQLTKPIRATFVEELKMTKLDDEFFKEYTSGGNIVLNVLYGNAQTFRSQAKIITTGQNEPNMRADGGILRRGILMPYPSRFLEDIEEDNWEKKEFKKIRNFDKLFFDDAMKLAYFHVLIDNFGELKIPKSLRDNFKQSLDEADNFKNAFEDIFEITDEENLMSKYTIINELSKNKYDWRFILAEMKRLGCIYNNQKKLNGRRGVFTNVKKIEEVEYIENDEC